MKKVVTILILSLLTLTDIYADSNFALPRFYSRGNPYTYLETPKEKKDLKNDCDAYVVPFFGIRTDKRYVYSATKAATNGLVAVLNGEIEKGRICANSLLKNSIKKGDSLLFPFKFDYVPYMPFNLRSGWVSAISQGLSLGLFVHLYEKTGEKEDLKIAQKIFNSYLIPVEKGGFTRFYKDSVFFEEYPSSEFIGVFNGSAISALALWDYYLVTEDKRALDLFNKYVKWLENNIERYEKVDGEKGVVFSYYSLAIRRPEILFRFVGEAAARISLIKFYGYNGNKEVKLFEQRVGIKGDDDPINDIYLWADDRYTNWSEEKREGRVINKRRGIYNHSPFYVRYEKGYKNYSIEIKYEILSSGRLDLQAYDGNEYYKIGELSGKAGDIVERKFLIDEKMLSNFVKNISNEPIVEYKYLDDNYLLLSIIAELSRSEKLYNHSNIWKESLDYVDYVSSEYYLENPRLEILINKKKIYIVENRCKFGVSGMSLIKYDNRYYLFYGCEVEKGQSRISLAMGDRIDNLKPMGWIFNNVILKERNINYMTNPYVIISEQDPQNPLIKLFFISKDNLFLSMTADVWRFNEIYRLNFQTGSPFIIINDEDPARIAFIDPKESNKIVLSYLNNPSQIYTSILENRHRRFTDIAYTTIDAHKIILARAELPKRVDSYIYVECKKGHFTDLAMRPFAVEKSFIKEEDTVKKNYFIFSEDGKYYLLYTGSTVDSDDKGTVYIREFSKELLIKIIHESCKN